MGGKSSTSTSQVSIPPSVLAQYNAVNSKATATANTPFQDYSGQFVAPVNDEQYAGINATNAYANAAQPYYQTATAVDEGATGAADQEYGTAAGTVNQAAGLGAAYNTAATNTLGTAQSGLSSGLGAAQQQYNSAYSSAQPYNTAATEADVAGASAVDPTQLNSSAINQYLSPYLGDVASSESALLNQNNQEAMSGQTGNAIQSGAFGGDRSGIAAANLSQQQDIANANIYSGILNTGYNTALSTAEGQQSLGLGAAQANRTALQTAGTNLASLGNQEYTQGTGLGAATQGVAQAGYTDTANTAAQQAAIGEQGYSQGLSTAGEDATLGTDVANAGTNEANTLSGLGTASQTSGLAGAAAEQAAGATEQTTQQAQDTAEYNQFLQQQSYPFQVDQFLANIAEGTGSLSGSTTTNTTPGSLFSDRRLKENIKEIGKLKDGQKLYRYNYKGENVVHVGLIAQEVEKKHPEAVGESQGFKTVEYGAATDHAARMKRAAGGLAFADGGSAVYGPYQAGGLYGSGQGRVPNATLPVGKLAVGQPSKPPPGGLHQLASDSKDVSDLWDTGGKLSDAAQTGVNRVTGHYADADNTVPTTTITSGGLNVDPSTLSNDTPDPASLGLASWRGGARGYADGGDVDPYTADGDSLNIPNQQNDRKLATSNPSAPQQSGLGQLAGDAKDASALIQGGEAVASGASAAAGGLSQVLPFLLAAKRGGRIERADGGLAGRNGYDGVDGQSAVIPTSDSDADNTSGGLAAGVIADSQPDNYDPNAPIKVGKSIPKELIHAKVQPFVGDFPGFQSKDPDASTYTTNDNGSVTGQLGQSTIDAATADSRMNAPPAGSPAKQAAAKKAAPTDPLAYLKNRSLNLDQVEDEGQQESNPTPAGGLQPISAQTSNPLTPSPIGGLQAPSDLDRTSAYAGQSPTAIPDDPSHPISAPGGLNPQQPAGAGDDLKQAGLGVIQKIKDVTNSYGKALMSGDKNAWIPLLTTLQAASAAQTRNPLTAWAQGLGAGAQSYMTTQQQEANIAGKQATTALTDAQTAAANRGLMFGKSPNGQALAYVKGSDGAIHPIPYGQWLAYSPQQKAQFPLMGTAGATGAADGTPTVAPGTPGYQAPAAPAGGAPAPQQPGTANVGAPSAPGAPGAPSGGGVDANGLPTPPKAASTAAPLLGPSSQANLASDERASQTWNEERAQHEDALFGQYEKETAAGAADAHKMGQLQQQLGAELGNMPTSGPGAGGVLFAAKKLYADRINDVARTLGLPVQVAPDELGSAAAADKINNILSFGRTNGADQHAYAAIEAAQKTFANTQMSPQAAAEVLAGSFIDKQVEQDRQAHLNQYKTKGDADTYGNAHYTRGGAEGGFNADMDQTGYMQDKQALKRLFGGTFNKDGQGYKAGDRIMPALMQGKLSDADLQRLTGRKNLSRYFTNVGG